MQELFVRHTPPSPPLRVTATFALGELGTGGAEEPLSLETGTGHHPGCPELTLARWKLRRGGTYIANGPLVVALCASAARITPHVPFVCAALLFLLFSFFLYPRSLTERRALPRVLFIRPAS